MKNEWQLQEAKNKFSEVVNRALKSGPQKIKRRGKEVAVLISYEEFKKSKIKKGSLVDFFRKSPLSGLDIKIERQKDLPRDVLL